MEKTLEQVLQNALDMLRRYPEELEEVCNQLNLITKACESEAVEIGLEYVEGTHHTQEV